MALGLALTMLLALGGAALYQWRLRLSRRRNELLAQLERYGRELTRGLDAQTVHDTLARQLKVLVGGGNDSFHQFTHQLGLGEQPLLTGLKSL
jgi:hypothetical protein